MELNLKYYKGTDEYSDGDIEDKIIDFIKKYPDDYEKAFEEDSSWPVFYHLSSIRKNVISWYPFKKNASILEVGAGMGAITSELVRKCKKVTSMELSKRRATAILERNKNAKNLEIIVGNFNDIELKEKYDYILLNGVLEYAALYMNSSNPYVDFINKLKAILKPDGKILIAIENRFGLKYWCGANEDHTNKKFDSITNYRGNNSIRTFSKFQLEQIAFLCGLNINFYYMFPDYKFPELILTDSTINSSYFKSYQPYFSVNTDVNALESEVFNDIIENNTIPFFSNSYFMELSYEKLKTEVEYVKFNNYRNKNENVYTYVKDNKFYKASIFETNNQIDIILNNYKLLEKMGLPITKVYKENKKVYTDLIEGLNCLDLLVADYKNGDSISFFKRFDDYVSLLNKSCGKCKEYFNTIFEKYGIKLTKAQKQKIKIYEHGFLDLVPSNIIYNNGEYIVIDQEWYESNVPVDYIIYRAIRLFIASIEFDEEIEKKLLDRYRIDKSLYRCLDNKFLDLRKSKTYNMFVNNYVNNFNFCHDINMLKQNLLNEKNNLQFEIENQKKNIEELNSVMTNIKSDYDSLYLKYQNVVQSKRWKFINKFLKIFKR